MRQCGDFVRFCAGLVGADAPAVNILSRAVHNWKVSNRLMQTDLQRLNAEEQKIAKLIAARLIVSVTDVATVIIETERCTKMVGVYGLPLQVCESYHELMKTSQQGAERILKENLLHCAGNGSHCHSLLRKSFSVPLAIEVMKITNRVKACEQTREPFLI